MVSLRLIAAASAIAILGATGAAARAEPSDQCYSLDATVLTGPAGADLTARVTTAPGCDVPAALKKLQIKMSSGADRREVSNLKNVPLVSGAATIELGRLARGDRVEVDALVDPEEGGRTEVVRSETVALLRPDLVVASLQAPAQTLSVRPIDVRAEVVERNGDVGAKATATLSWGPSLLATQDVVVAPGGSTTVVFAAVALTTPVPVGLTVQVGGADPTETDATNNDRSTNVDVTEHELARSRLILDMLGGYGTQFNHHVFANITPIPQGAADDLEPKVDALEPQFVRIFFNDEHENPTAFPDRWASFVDVVRMAHETGARINITYQTIARARLNPGPKMAEFADVLKYLVVDRGYTNVDWVTIGNEVNSTTLPLDQYENLNRLLHAELVARGIQDDVGIMAGDLVESGGGGHRVWMQYIATHMADIVDAYSEHIYWNYWDVPRMEFRLRDVAKLMFEELPAEARRPVYITEFGVRGVQTNFPGKPNLPGGYYADGTPVTRTNIAAFQQLWFHVAAAQLGFDGTSKWDAYWGIYDVNRFGVPNQQAYYLIGPAEEGWPLFPTYHALRLLFQTTAPGWQILGVDPWADDDWQTDVADQQEKEIAAYAGPSGELTLIGLDSHGRDLNAAAPESPAAYSVGGLPPNTEFALAVWNAAANGENAIGVTVTTNSAGVARFSVPIHGGFALTTVPVA